MNLLTSAQRIAFPLGWCVLLVAFLIALALGGCAPSYRESLRPLIIPWDPHPVLTPAIAYASNEKPRWVRATVHSPLNSNYTVSVEWDQFRHFPPNPLTGTAAARHDGRSWEALIPIGSGNPANLGQTKYRWVVESTEILYSPRNRPHPARPGEPDRDLTERPLVLARSDWRWVQSVHAVATVSLEVGPNDHPSGVGRDIPGSPDEVEVEFAVNVNVTGFDSKVVRLEDQFHNIQWQGDPTSSFSSPIKARLPRGKRFTCVGFRREQYPGVNHWVDGLEVEIRTRD